jgi:hypothetical protein
VRKVAAGVGVALALGTTVSAQAPAAIPIPRPLTAAAQRLPPTVLAQYIEVLHGLVRPLHDAATREWERAAESTSDLAASLARQRLAGITVPDC